MLLPAESEDINTGDFSGAVGGDILRFTGSELAISADINTTSPRDSSGGH